MTLRGAAALIFSLPRCSLTVSITSACSYEDSWTYLVSYLWSIMRGLTALGMRAAHVCCCWNRCSFPCPHNENLSCFSLLFQRFLLIFNYILISYFCMWVCLSACFWRPEDNVVGVIPSFLPVRSHPALRSGSKCLVSHLTCLHDVLKCYLMY